jgi:chitin synthase
MLGRIWGVYHQKLYDLTDYVHTLGLNQNSATFAFLDNDFLSVFRQRSGQDITQPLDSVLNSMNSTYRAAHMACIENVFLSGQTDFRTTPRCQVQNYMLIVISGILMASIALKCNVRLLNS